MIEYSIMIEKIIYSSAFSFVLPGYGQTGLSWMLRKFLGLPLEKLDFKLYLFSIYTYLCYKAQAEYKCEMNKQSYKMVILFLRS